MVISVLQSLMAPIGGLATSRVEHCAANGTANPLKNRLQMKNRRDRRAGLIGGSTEAVLIRGTCESTLATTSLLFNAAFFIAFPPCDAGL